jgi:RNAse (barnase) inhibitor barstar
MPFDAAAASALCTLARSLGCACVRIDLAGCIDKKALLAEIAHALEFPEWFGNNWDALFDCLADLGWLPAKGHVLVLENAAELRAEAPEVFDTALAIFEDAAASWASRGAAFRVFVSA